MVRGAASLDLKMWTEIFIFGVIVITPFLEAGHGSCLALSLYI